MAETDKKTVKTSSTERQNMNIFESVRSVDEKCKKAITAGKLKGMTNINPMWRIEKLTKLFGPCGIGWWIDNVRYSESFYGQNELVVWCELDLYIKGFDHPIYGVGGSKLYGKGIGKKDEFDINDECRKMAMTDAISVACKNLGFAADVYYGIDDTKYTEAGNRAWNPLGLQAQPQQPNIPDLGQIIAMVKACKTKEELENIWNTYAPYYGNSEDFQREIAIHPANKA